MSREKLVHKGKSRIWIGSIIAAFIAAIAVFIVMMEMEKNLLLQYEKGTIFIAVEEIPKGRMITLDNYEKYIAEMELDRNCIPGTALVSVEQINDMMPMVNIEKGVLLTTGMFEEVDEITAGMQNPVIAGFKSEDLYQVVGGVLRTGDRINIYQVAETGEAALHWQNVFVQQVFDNAGLRIECDDEQTPAQRINIYLEQGQVEQFYSQLEAGTLRVVKVCK